MASAKKTSSGGSGISAAKTSLSEGLSNDSPMASDASTQCSGPSVNNFSDPPSNGAIYKSLPGRVA
jgi:hypothetical protein